VGPFSGLKVVEFGRFIAAPYCGQLLADGGADVVKVESLEGDDTRRTGPVLPTEGRQYLNKNRGKRSLSVDLNNEDAGAAVKRLVARADIVIANFRPGRAQKLGLDYESVRATNERIIYAENTAYGEAGPMAGAPGMDIVMQGYSGLATVTPAGPVPNASPIIDYTAGLLLAWGVSTALYHRERTGHGQRLDVSLLQAALVLQNNQMNHIDAIDGWRDGFVEFLKTAFADGLSWEEVITRRRELHPYAIARAYYGFHPTADGTLALAAGSRKLRERLLQLLELDDPWVTQPGWMPVDARLHADRVASDVEVKLRTNTTAHWTAECARIGVPAGPVHLSEELLDDRQAWENGYFVRLEHELLGGITVVAPPVKFSGTPLSAERASQPLGAQTCEVLAEAEMDEAAIQRLLEHGGAKQWK
jgi:CoA:oxalate CoA-transferase